APIVSRVDLYSPYWIATGLFVAAGLLILFAHIPRVVRELPPDERHPFKQVALEVKEGMDALRRSPVLLLSFYQLSLAVMVGFMLGLEFGAMMIPALSALMENASDSVRGRIFALLFMVVNGAIALPVLLTAALSDVVGTNRVIGGLGILLVATGLLTARYAQRVFGAARAPG